MRTPKRSFAPWSMWRDLSSKGYLIFELSKREILGRYRGSILGVFWSFLNPVIMLLVYTFVFHVVLKGRWEEGQKSRSEFALIIFTGLTVFTLFSELINRSPSLIVSNVSFVKKVVFPLEIFPCVALGTALFHASVGFLILLAANFFLNHNIHWTFVFFPIILLPLIFLILGLSWFLCSLGAFVRDIGQVVATVTQILMFMTPIFYPTSAVPERLRMIIAWNPLTFIIEQMRGVFLEGHTPDWLGLALYFILGSTVAWLGLVWFEKTRNGFANVL